MKKPVLYHMQTTKAQISLHIHVVFCPDSIIANVAKSELSRLKLVSTVAEQADLSVSWLQTLKERFFRDVAELLSKSIH